MIMLMSRCLRLLLAAVSATVIVYAQQAGPTGHHLRGEQGLASKEAENPPVRITAEVSLNTTSSENADLGVGVARELSRFSCQGGTDRFYITEDRWYCIRSNRVIESVHASSFLGSRVVNKDLTESTGARFAADGSSVVGFFVKGDQPRVYYIDDLNHVNELWWNGSEWGHSDITQRANAPLAAAGSALVGFALSGQYSRVYYLGAGDGKVHELWWSGSRWSHTDLMAASGARLAMDGSPLTGFAVSGDKPRVYYLDTDTRHHVMELWWSGSDWGQTDVTVAARAPPAASWSDLTHRYTMYPASWSDLMYRYTYPGSGVHNQHTLYYFRGDGNIHSLAWTGTRWEYDRYTNIIVP